jgi:carbon storage regulator
MMVLRRGTHHLLSAAGNLKANQGRRNMLVLSRKAGEKVVIGDNITVQVVRVKGNRVTIGIVAPANVPVLRNELSKITTAKLASIELVVEDGLLVAS